MTKDGVSLFFKSRLGMREPDFDRELQILSRISSVDLKAESRVSRLKRVVVSGAKGDVTMGVLMSLITSPKVGSHLRDKGLWDNQELHKKLKAQVAATMKELYAKNIVWGA